MYSFKTPAQQPQGQYRSPAGRLFEVHQILDTPFWSRKAQLAAAGKISYFDESGSPDIEGNMEAAGQFSRSQSFVCRKVQVDISIVTAAAFTTVAQVDFVADIIQGCWVALNKNRGQDWQCHLNKMLKIPGGQLVTTTGASQYRMPESVSGEYVFNEPLVFGPAETFTFTLHQEHTVDTSTLQVMFNLLGFLATEKTVEKA